ncbi:MAG TPA: GGDEF domain-containing protein [Alicycliphilus sp.]|nr:GGDEF domain-containing protein [Alicycliphilus sp.]
MAAPLTVAVAALLTLWVPVWQALLWAGIEIVTIAVYIGVYLQFRRAAPGPQDEALWARRIALAHGAHMVLWSSIVVWAYEPGNLTSLMFVMLVHVGLISLTAAMSNPYRSLLVSDLAIPTVALVAPPLLDGSLFSLGLTALGGLYISLMLMVGLKIHASTTETLVLRLRNEALIRELERQAQCDGLTGLSNRKHFLHTGRAELERAGRYRHPLALLMLDIDHFKQINDSHGHLAGDEVLRAVAQVCQAAVRANDCLARLGGEEFAVLMPETTLAQATAAAERLRMAVARLCCELSHDVVVMPRMSIGVAIAENGAESLSSLMRRGDRAMYEAKSKGRNRVIVAASAAAELAA